MRTEIRINFSSFTSGTVQQWQKCSAIVLLSRWGLGLFERPTSSVCKYIRGSLNKFPDIFRMGTFIDSNVTRNWVKSQNGTLFRTCEDGAGWHLIPYRISPRSEFFSQACKTWHITWRINLGLDWPPLARGSKFHTITHPPGRFPSFP